MTRCDDRVQRLCRNFTTQCLRCSFIVTWPECCTGNVPRMASGVLTHPHCNRNLLTANRCTRNASWCQVHSFTRHLFTPIRSARVHSLTHHLIVTSSIAYEMCHSTKYTHSHIIYSRQSLHKAVMIPGTLTRTYLLTYQEHSLSHTSFSHASHCTRQS